MSHNSFASPLDSDDALECMKSGSEDGCSGPVELHSIDPGRSEPIPRCAKHWQERLEVEERLRRDYPDSDVPPAWFDPTAAGERWSDDY